MTNRSASRNDSSRWIAPALEALAHTGLMGSPMALSSWASTRFDAIGGKPARRG